LILIYLFIFFKQKNYFLHWWRCKMEDSGEWGGVSDSYLQTFGNNQEKNSSLWRRWLLFSFNFCICLQSWNNFQVSSHSVLSVVLISTRPRQFHFQLSTGIRRHIICYKLCNIDCETSNRYSRLRLTLRWKLSFTQRRSCVLFCFKFAGPA